MMMVVVMATWASQSQEHDIVVIINTITITIIFVIQ